MLDLSIENLMREIRDARKRLRPMLDKRAEIIRSFAGPHYRDDATERAPENYPFAYKSFVKPQILFGRPTVKVEPSTIMHAATASALELAVNYWSKETSQKSTLSEVVDDVFFGFGMTKCGVSPVGHYNGQEGEGLQGVEGDFEQVPNYPFRVRVDPRTVIIDPRANKLSKCRFIGHSYEQDVEDVQKDWRNDPEAAAKLTAYVDRETDSGGSTAPFPLTNAGDTQDRKRMTLYELYLPEHGRLITIAETGAEHGVVLRDEKYFGPDEGPYTLWGLESVSGELIPISPLQALWDEFKEVTTHSRTAAASAATHKKIGVYGHGAVEDAKRIQNARPGEMIGVQDPNAVKDFELGGASEAQVSWVQYVRDRLEHNLGYGQAQQGVAGKQTATGEQIANANSDLRIDQMRDRIADCAAADYQKVGWFFFHDSSIGRLDMTHTDPMTGMSQPATFVAGQWPGGFVQNQYVPAEDPTDFYDYNFTVDAQLMVKTDDVLEQKRAQDEMALTVQMAGVFGPQAINWRRMIDRYGEKMGTKDLSKIMLLDQMGMMIPPDPFGGPGQMGQTPGMKPAGGMGGAGQPGAGMGATPAMPSVGGGPETQTGLMANARGGV